VRHTKKGGALPGDIKTMHEKIKQYARPDLQQVYDRQIEKYQATGYSVLLRQSYVTTCNVLKNRR
jgi:hypothetical protein